MLELITSMLYIKEKNQILKERNSKLIGVIAFLDKCEYFESKMQFKKNLKIIAVLETNNKDCVKTVYLYTIYINDS